MAADNSPQIAEWNGPLGARWATQQEEMDALTAPYGQDALNAAAAQPGERVLDVGCGCGASTLALGRAVGASGAVVGADIARAMLEVARRRAAEAGLSHITFTEADASSASLPQDLDLICSRFGVMFFADPVAAFAHMRSAMKGVGRLAFVCWRAARDNPWASVPVAAARQALKLEAPAGDPHAPGPFAFADHARVSGILTDAGFREIEIEPFEHLMPLGSNPRAAAEYATRSGPVARLVREAGPENTPRIIEAVEKAITPLAGRDGSISLPGRTWVVTAKAD
ncbi:MAG TPA: class I SAM-dependent methyltransferase [Hyphomonadaceae bacterium]|jgi:SAM-dependent methyltransferase|nr:class I SAM-dependent methyltransferase [Hyphomonadaceae bacterium]